MMRVCPLLALLVLAASSSIPIGKESSGDMEKDANAISRIKRAREEVMFGNHQNSPRVKKALPPGDDVEPEQEAEEEESPVSAELNDSGDGDDKTVSGPSNSDGDAAAAAADDDEEEEEEAGAEKPAEEDEEEEAAADVKSGPEAVDESEAELIPGAPLVRGELGEAMQGPAGEYYKYVQDYYGGLDKPQAGQYGVMKSEPAQYDPDALLNYIYRQRRNVGLTHRVHAKRSRRTKRDLLLPGSTDDMITPYSYDLDAYPVEDTLIGAYPDSYKQAEPEVAYGIDENEIRDQMPYFGSVYSKRGSIPADEDNSLREFNDNDEDEEEETDVPYSEITIHGQPGIFIPIKRQFLSLMPGTKRKRNSFYPFSQEPRSHWGAFVAEKRDHDEDYKRLLELARALADRRTPLTYRNDISDDYEEFHK